MINGNRSMFRVEVLLDGAAVTERGPYENIGEARRRRSILKKYLRAGDVLGIPVQEVADRVKVRISVTDRNSETGRWDREWTQIEGDL